jgi:hypothetical protein
MGQSCKHGPSHLHTTYTHHWRADRPHACTRPSEVDAPSAPCDPGSLAAPTSARDSTPQQGTHTYMATRDTYAVRFRRCECECESECECECERERECVGTAPFQDMAPKNKGLQRHTSFFRLRATKSKSSSATSSTPAKAAAAPATPTPAWAPLTLPPPLVMRAMRTSSSMCRWRCNRPGVAPPASSTQARARPPPGRTNRRSRPLSSTSGRKTSSRPASTSPAWSTCPRDRGTAIQPSESLDKHAPCWLPSPSPPSSTTLPCRDTGSRSGSVSLTELSMWPPGVVGGPSPLPPPAPPAPPPAPAAPPPAPSPPVQPSSPRQPATSLPERPSADPAACTAPWPLEGDAPTTGCDAAAELTPALLRWPGLLPLLPPSVADGDGTARVPTPAAAGTVTRSTTAEDTASTPAPPPPLVREGRAAVAAAAAGVAEGAVPGSDVLRPPARRPLPATGAVAADGAAAFRAPAARLPGPLPDRGGDSPSRLIFPPAASWVATSRSRCMRTADDDDTCSSRGGEKLGMRHDCGPPSAVGDGPSPPAPLPAAA